MRALSQIVAQGCSVSRAAIALDVPQPGISRQLRSLERELGVDIFRRNRKRWLGLTVPGAAIVKVARRMVEDAETLGKIGREFSAADSGSLTVATTHTQSRYALPSVIKSFAARYPNKGSAHAAPGQPGRTDTDVIKSYVELGLGIAIVAQLAFDRVRDRNLRSLDASHLFASNTIHLGLRRNDYLRSYMFDFIEIYAPRLRRNVVEKALAET